MTGTTLKETIVRSDLAQELKDLSRGAAIVGDAIFGVAKWTLYSGAPVAKMAFLAGAYELYTGSSELQKTVGGYLVSAGLLRGGWVAIRESPGIIAGVGGTLMMMGGLVGVAVTTANVVMPGSQF